VGKDERDGLRLLNLASGHGFAPAQLELSDVYFDCADTIPANHVLAARYLRLAADAGLARAQRSPGLALLEGDGVERDEAETARYFEKAAEQGDAAGPLHHARRLEESPRGIAQARRYFERAAERRVTEAMLSLALMYAAGRGVAQDAGRAAPLCAVRSSIRGSARSPPRGRSSGTGRPPRGTTCSR